MPDKPDGDYRPCVYNDGDGWDAHWYSDTEEIDVIDFHEEHAWPFKEDIADEADWRRLGFEIM